jgi:filamentous hemagglutinin
LKDGYTGDTRSVMYSQTPLETVGRYAGYVGDFATSLLPGSSLPSVGEQAGKGNHGMAALLLGTELLGPIGGELRTVNGLEKAALKDTTSFISGVKIVDQKTGAALEGTVDLRATLNRIESGGTFPHRNDGSVFMNRAGDLPQQSAGYYTEYVHPTPGVSGPGPQRVVTGQGGEIYYTPDHYNTFIPIR